MTLHPQSSFTDTGQPSDTDALFPQLRIRASDLMTIDGAKWFAQERVGSGWLLRNVETNEANIFSDSSLRNFLTCGRLVRRSRATTALTAAQPAIAEFQSPLLGGDRQKSECERRYDYVRHVLDQEEGYRCSKPWIGKKIAAYATKRGETPPSSGSVINWVKRYQAGFDQFGLSALATRHDLKGRTGPKVHPLVEEAMQAGIHRYLSGTTKKTAYADVIAKLDELQADLGDRERAELPLEAMGNDGKLKPPSRRTFERRCSDIPHDERDAARVGMNFAKRRYRTYTTQPRPDRPYAEVEVDRTPLDVILVDESGIVLGRPDLLVFKDRATSMIAGFSVSFDEPSWASLIDGLRHAIYPKDMSTFPNVENPWPAFGRIETLIVDNGMEFIGGNMESAAKELGFRLVRCQPRQPFQKGEIERFFRTFSTGLAHQLDGTTLSNAIQRRDYEVLGEATFTLGEFVALIMKWICDVYHQQISKGLGPIRGVGGIPIKEWEKKVRNYDVPALPDPDLFIHLAGDRDQRTIQKNGITWDYIVYESAELGALLRHPKHRSAGQRGGPTKYNVSRDPYDLGSIRVEDSYNNQVLMVPACRGHVSYADGLTLHQHRVAIRYTKRFLEASVNIASLSQAMSELSEIGRGALNSRKRKQISRQLKRFWKSDEARRFQSQTSVLAPIGDGGYEPLKWEPVEVESNFLSAAAPPTTPQQAQALSCLTEDDDLDALDEELNWSSSSE